MTTVANGTRRSRTTAGNIIDEQIEDLLETQSLGTLGEVHTITDSTGVPLQAEDFGQTVAPPARLTLPALRPDNNDGVRLWGYNYTIDLVHDATQLQGIESYLNEIALFDFTKGELYLRSLYVVLNREINAAKGERDSARARKLTALIIVVRRLFDGGFQARDLAFAVSSIEGKTLTNGEQLLVETAWSRFRATDPAIRHYMAEADLDSPEVILHYYDTEHNAGNIKKFWVDMRRSSSSNA